MKQITIRGMSCEHCVRAATEALAGLGLQNVRVDLASGVASFDEGDVSEQALRDALEEEGFTLENAQ